MGEGKRRGKGGREEVKKREKRKEKRIERG